MSTGESRLILDSASAVAGFRHALSAYGIYGNDFEEIIQQIIGSLLGDYATFEQQLHELPDLYRIGVEIPPDQLPLVKARILEFGLSLKAHLVSLGVPRQGANGLIEFDFYYDCLLNEDLVLRAFPY